MDINRLEKFILLLGSDQAGEVVNAAGMLVKALKKDGKDLHALTAMLNGGRSSTPPPRSDAGQVARLVAENQRLKQELQKTNQVRNALQVENRELQRQLQVLQNTINLMQRGPSQPQTATETMYREQMFEQARQAQQFAYNQFNHPYQAYQPKQEPDYVEMARWALAYGHDNKLLTVWEDEFLADMVGLPFAYSFKQASKIEDIYARLKRVEAARG